MDSPDAIRVKSDCPKEKFRSSIINYGNFIGSAQICDLKVYGLRNTASQPKQVSTVDVQCAKVSKQIFFSPLTSNS
jgi:hypothetical protein